MMQSILNDPIEFRDALKEGQQGMMGMGDEPGMDDEI
jgi:hypothetical protein